MMRDLESFPQLSAPSVGGPEGPAADPSPAYQPGSPQEDIEQAPPFDFGEETTPTGRKPRADRGKKRGTRGPRKPKAQKLAEEIRPDVEQTLGLLSLALVPLSPTASEYNESHVDRNVQVIANLCIRHPRMLEYIRQAGGFAAYFEVAQFLIGMVLCVMVDLNRIEPDAILAHILGVSEAYRTTYGEEPSRNGNEAPRDSSIPTPSLLANTQG